MLYRKQIAQHIGLASAVLSTIIALFAYLFPTEPHRSIEKPNTHFLKENISINYARLFGAYQVPYYLVGNNSVDATNSPSGITFIMNNEVKKFFETWEYANAIPVLTPAFKELFDASDENVPPGRRYMIKANNADSVGVLYVRFCEDDKSFDVAKRYILKSYPDYNEEDIEGLSEVEWFYYYLKAKYSSVVPKDVISRVELNSDKVGYLVLYLENINDETIFDVAIESKIVRLNELDKEMAANVVEQGLAQAPIANTTIPIIKSHQKILLLLCVYMKDSSGYPLYYLSSVMRPQKISYRIKGSGERIEQIIREPLKDKAAKFYMPMGWYAQ